jgi:hypothetical protein
MFAPCVIAGFSCAFEVDDDCALQPAVKKQAAIKLILKLRLRFIDYPCVMRKIINHAYDTRNHLTVQYRKGCYLLRIHPI